MKNILIFGDVCPRWGNGEQFDIGNPEVIFHDILPLMKEADLVVGNLEAPATDSEKPITKTSMNLKCKPDDLKVLKEAGFSAFSCCNNHILDYGTEGLKETISNSQKENLELYGYEKENQEIKPYIKAIDGKTIAFLCFAEHEFNCAVDYGIGAALWDDLISIQQIRTCKKQCDYLIIQYHGGIEEYEYPSPKLQKRCRSMIEAGADLVTCQHSHCIGTRESWAEGEILYGQGNSVFGYEEGKRQWNTGLIIKLSLGWNMTIDYIPIEARKDGIYLQSKEDAGGEIQRLSNRSAKLGNKDWLSQNWKDFCMQQRNTYLPLAFGWRRLLLRINRLIGGSLIPFFCTKASKMCAMNMLRCDAHKEVVETILEQEFYN